MSFRCLSRGLARCAVPRPGAWKATPLPSSRLTTPFPPSYCCHDHGGFALTLVRTFASKKKKSLLRHAKGFRGRSKNCFRVAIRRLQKSWQYAYRDRRRKRREWSKLWIQRIQAGVRQYSWRYSHFMGCYNKTDLKLDRKVLAELAANEPFAFRSVVQVVEHCSGQNAPSSSSSSKVAQAASL